MKLFIKYVFQEYILLNKNKEKPAEFEEKSLFLQKSYVGIYEQSRRSIRKSV